MQAVQGIGVVVEGVMGELFCTSPSTFPNLHNFLKNPQISKSVKTAHLKLAVSIKNQASLTTHRSSGPSEGADEHGCVFSGAM